MNLIELVWPVAIILLGAFIVDYTPDLKKVFPLIIGTVTGFVLFAMNIELRKQLLIVIVVYILTKLTCMNWYRFATSKNCQSTANYSKGSDLQGQSKSVE